jgi:hypothetical protein
MSRHPKRVATPKYHNALLYIPLIMFPPHQVLPSNQEGRILLAIQALKLSQFQSVKAAAIAYDVPRTTLRNRINGMPSRCDTPSNAQRLTSQEEEAVIQYILDLDSRGFPPQPQAVQEMANILLVERDAPLVSKNWTTN